MRVSELLDREPFGLILEKTLSDYWSITSGSSVDVLWNSSMQGYQKWYGNKFLNFFCTCDIDACCFENIIREFGYAKNRWRRIFQRAYVHAAVNAPSRSWLSQVSFRVSPFIPDANHQLVLGGRNRLRIIHPYEGLSVVITKSGMSRKGFDREVSARQGFAKDLAPEFFGLRANGIAFSEEYFIGTPTNRLPSEVSLLAREEACVRLIEIVHRPYIKAILVCDYLDQLVSIIANYSHDIAGEAMILANYLSSYSQSVFLGITMTHGDFQNANILCNARDLRIIDWETATPRSQLYDLATLSSDIRLSNDYFNSWREQVYSWLTGSSEFPDLLVPIDGRLSTICHSVVWLLEEIIFQIDENDDLLFSNCVSSYILFAADIGRAHQLVKSYL